MSAKIILHPAVHSNNGVVYADSRDIAKYFEKRHADVVRSIKTLEKDCSEQFWQRNFALRDGTDELGKHQPFYDIKREGFTRLEVRTPRKKQPARDLTHLIQAATL